MRILGIVLLTAILTASGTPAAVEVFFVRPQRGVPLFGEVEVEVEILDPSRVESVELLLDGESAGLVEGPPYRATLDMGQDNRGHEIRVLVRESDGAVSEETMTVPAIRIDERIDAELQQIYVTAMRDGERVLDLRRGEIKVLDDGVEQQIVTFSRGDLPLASIILVDASASMRGRRLRFALDAAEDFARNARRGDEISIQLFSDRLSFASPFSSDLATLTAGLTDVRAQGGTALNDHLYRSLKLLEARQGRRVAIFLSDGIDSHSALRMSQVSWLARRSRTMIYWIQIDPTEMVESRYSAWKSAEQYRDEYRELRQTVTESGGRVVTLARIEDAEAAVREVLSELREQYVVGYYPSTRRGDGAWHKVSVRVARPGVSLRARGGYVGF